MTAQEHSLANFTPQQLQALPNKDSALVIVNLAAIEQHGLHLPTGTDSYLGQTWLDLTFEHLTPQDNIYIAPPLLIGRSTEHIDYPGTLNHDTSTLRSQIFHAAAQIKAWGFQKIAFFNTHGGNITALNTILPEIEQELGLQTHKILWYPKPENGKITDPYDKHAGEIETAWMLHCAPNLVQMDKALDEVPTDPANSTVKPAFKPASFAWMISDLSKFGTLGLATKATPEKGKAWMNTAVSELIQTLRAIQ